jgi:Protein of unknown function (DUF2934)
MLFCRRRSCAGLTWKKHFSASRKGVVVVKSGSYSSVNLQEVIRKRAEEIYIRNGRLPGRDIENWSQAEAEIESERAKDHGRRTAIVVTVDGVQYIGEYDPRSTGYNPGEFAAGQPMPVRFDGNKMFIRRRDGTELETTIIRKIG